MCVPNEVTLISVGGWLIKDLLCPKSWSKFTPGDYHFYFWNRITLGTLMKYAGFELEKSKALTFEFPLLGHGKISKIFAKCFSTLSTPVIIKGRKARNRSFFFEEVKRKSFLHSGVSK